MKSEERAYPADDEDEALATQLDALINERQRGSAVPASTPDALLVDRLIHLSSRLLIENIVTHHPLLTIRPRHRAYVP